MGVKHSHLFCPFFVVESYARRLNVSQKYLAKLNPHFLNNHIIVGRLFALGKPPNAANADEEAGGEEGFSGVKAVARYR